MVKFCKKIIVALMVVGMVFALAACSKSTVEEETIQSDAMPVEGETGGREDKVPDPNAPVLGIDIH